jgi:2-C-methyl-D-erythritol 4-phosphate cytidylyltransferase
MADKVAAVIVAAGRSTRMAGLDKQFTPTAGKVILAHTVAVFEASPLIDEYVIVLNESNLMRGRALAYEEGWRKLKRIVTGGARRQDSVWAGLQVWANDPALAWVMVHDGARPFVTENILADGLRMAQAHGASVAAVPVKDTIKLVEPESGLVTATPPRDRLWAIQTPQIFQYSALVKAHEAAIAQNLDVTDDAMLLEHLGQPVRVYPASYTNFKITTPDDLVLASHLFQGTGVREQGSGNRGQGTGVREQGSGNRGQGTGRTKIQHPTSNIRYGRFVTRHSSLVTPHRAGVRCTPLERGQTVNFGRGGSTV